MKIVPRNEVPEDYKEMMKTEQHHQHLIIEVDGILRWKANSVVRELTQPSIISLNDLIPLFQHLGYDANSEIQRKLYRDIGYSLSSYWEIFYWEVNNSNANSYIPPSIKI